MNANSTLQRVRDLVRSKMLELPPMAGEEMSLPQTDPHRDGFIEGERTIAAQVLALIDEAETKTQEDVSADEEEMILGLGKT